MKTSQSKENDVQTTDIVKQQLSALFSDFGIGLPQYKKFLQCRQQFREKVNKGAEMIHRIQDLVYLLQKISNTKDTKRKKNTFPFLFAVMYLSLVETVGDMFVNMAIMLLTAKGIDFHLEPDDNHRYTRHAQYLDEIESPSIPLSTKLDFISVNGLPFFSSWIDRNLRNNIAHMSFKIDDNGDFFALRYGKYRKIDLSEKITKFTEILTIVETVFNEQLKSVRAIKDEKDKTITQNPNLSS
jgi:hypothetical protein